MKIYERFHAFQGEGHFIGQSAFFVRVFGCPVGCPWCDSAPTWDTKLPTSSYTEMSIPELATEACATNALFTVLTGGEPTAQPIELLKEFVGTMNKVGQRVHLETSGYSEVPYGLFNWITFAPKRNPKSVFWAIANEIKLVVTDEESINQWLPFLDIVGYHTPIWLIPEWSRRSDADVAKIITKMVTTPSKYAFRAGIQMHKYFNCDQLDSRSRPGGFPNKFKP